MPQQTQFQPFNFQSDDGLMLYGRVYGDTNGSQPPVVCLAGLSRNSRDFHRFALMLAGQGRKVVTFDYRGRGLSSRDPDPANYNLGREAQDVLQGLSHLGIAAADFIGTSRGGLILHFLPAMAPGLVRSAVLNDVGPVIENEGLRRIRDYLSVRAEPRDFAHAARALRATHGVDFTILTDDDWADMAQAIFREIDGRILPDHDPALVEPLKSMDFDQPMPALWEPFRNLSTIPLLVVRGENSSLLMEETVEQMLEQHGHAAAVTALGQGHAPLLHVPGLAGPVAEFLSRR